MKRVKEKFLKKVKSISTITILKHGLIHQVYPPNGDVQTTPVYAEQEQKNTSFPDLVSEHRHSNKDEEFDSCIQGTNHVHAAELSDQMDLPMETELSAFHQVNPKSVILYHSEPLAQLDQVAMEHGTNHEAVDKKNSSELLNSEEKCPPGGNDSVILYTTSLRGIRKTFEDCNAIRFLLESFRILFQERDISMDLGYRKELWKIMGCKSVPPRLFIKGRHIGGADEVIGLHEQGKLKKLFQGIPLNPSNGPCRGCAGLRFMLCFNCNGSRKITGEGKARESQIRCPKCNENGLVICDICC